MTLPQPPASSMVRTRFAHALRRIVRTVTEAGRAIASPQPPPRPGPAEDDARERARLALMEARARMPGLLGEDEAAVSIPVPSAVTGAVEGVHVPAEARELRQALRTYTDRVDRLLAEAEAERRGLRDEIARLRAEVSTVRRALEDLRALPAGALPAAGLPAPPSASAPVPTIATNENTGEKLPTATMPGDVQRPAPVPSPPALHDDAVAGDAAAGASEPVAARVPGGDTAPVEDEDRARRVFPAGTIGVLVALRPVPTAARLTLLIDRLADAPAIEQIERRDHVDDVATLRLTFREPVPWPELRALLEGAAGARIDPAAVQFARGEVRAGFIEVQGKHPDARA